MLICSHSPSLRLEKFGTYFLACLEWDNHLPNFFLTKTMTCMTRSSTSIRSTVDTAWIDLQQFALAEKSTSKATAVAQGTAGDGSSVPDCVRNKKQLCCSAWLCLLSKSTKTTKNKQTRKKTKKKKNLSAIWNHNRQLTGLLLHTCSEVYIYSVQWQVLAARDWHTFYGNVLILEKFGHKLKMLQK